MRAHEIDYQIIGHDMQLVEIYLDPGETVIAEAGSMTYMDEQIGFETKMGDGADPDEGVFGKLFSAGKRMLTGESVFTTHFTHSGTADKATVAFSAPYPGSVMPLDLSQLGGQITCQKDAFLCAALGTRLDIAFNKRLGSVLFGGEGFILQKLEGDGLAFIQAGGTVVEK
ncbi:MAG: AIM24 family protein, partial [Candidatus Thiodiazotropha sp. (ex Semelilucina semeliformis)]|nr:AIM24 family protein [Candidatus Thiodiazotropha sp. (ex Semelilucina semeliformis)]